VDLEAQIWLDEGLAEKGYVKGNVVWTCFAINSFKQGLHEEEFLVLVNKIHWKNSGK
jgi:hypothetical protein